MSDYLLPWAPFFYSFGPGLFFIRMVADWWKLRLYLPLEKAQRSLRSATARTKRSLTTENLVGLKEKYATMDYKALSQKLNKVTPAASTSLEAQTILESAFESEAQKRLHVHHFIFGIPSMFVSWLLFVIGQGWWALIAAGLTAALFLSELKELITQQWEP